MTREEQARKNDRAVAKIYLKELAFCIAFSPVLLYLYLTKRL